MVADSTRPSEFDYRQLTQWLDELEGAATHRATHYELVATLEPKTATLEVEGRVTLAAEDHVSSAAGPGGPGPDLARHTPAVARFLLNPDLEILCPGPPSLAPASTAQPSATPGGQPATALRSVALAPGQTGLVLRYRGRLPEAWVSPQASELALYNLWYPVFSGRLLPFTFRLLLRVPDMTVSAVSGRLVPLPPGLVPKAHDHAQPREYLWESLCPGMDIAVAAGPYLVHQRAIDTLSAEVFVLEDDFDLGEPFLDWTERVLAVLQRWFGPLPAPSPAAPDRGPRAAVDLAPGQRLGVVVPPVSLWGGYSRPGHVVIPRPMAADLRSPATAKPIILMLAHELGHLWWGSGVLSDTVGEPWLSEGFAEFARLVFEEEEWGRAAYDQRLEQYRERVAGARDPKPMAAVRADDPEMDALARVRGGLLLAELRDLLGDRVMAEVLSGFAARHAGEFVCGADFVTEVSAMTSRSAGRDLGRFLSAYLEQPPGQA